MAGFLAEVGDLRRFESPRQIQKLAGLSLREHSSGKHKGQTTISKRGRSKQRAVLFNAVIPLIATNHLQIIMMILLIHMPMLIGIP